MTSLVAIALSAIASSLCQCILLIVVPGTSISQPPLATSSLPSPSLAHSSSLHLAASVCHSLSASLTCSQSPFPPSPLPISPSFVIMSYAEVAASGPRQSPREVSPPTAREALKRIRKKFKQMKHAASHINDHFPAAAPQPPEVLSTYSASTASLIDVDVPSVHTVHSDFLEQGVQTTTQTERRDREASASKAKAKAANDAASAGGSKKKNRDADKTAKTCAADSWLTKHFSDLSDGSAGALAAVNLAAVVGLSSYMGYKAWGLYEKGSLDWKNAGIGLGVLAAVGAMESVFGRCLYKGKKGDS